MMLIPAHTKSRLAGTGLALLALLFGVLVLSTPGRAQTSPAASSTPDPTLVALQQSVGDLSTQVAFLEREVSVGQQEVSVNLREQYLPYSGILVGLGVLGIGSPLVLYRWAEKRFQQRIDKAIYKTDPTRWTIHIPKDHFADEKAGLIQMGFCHFREYTLLEQEKLEGIFVVKAKGLDEIMQICALKDVPGVDPQNVAFILYTPEFIKGGQCIFQSFPKSVFTNSIATIATQIFAVSRLFL